MLWGAAYCGLSARTDRSYNALHSKTRATHNIVSSLESAFNWSLWRQKRERTRAQHKKS